MAFFFLYLSEVEVSCHLESQRERGSGALAFIFILASETTYCVAGVTEEWAEFQLSWFGYPNKQTIGFKYVISL